MCTTAAGARAKALELLLAGYTPEEVEDMLFPDQGDTGELTALTDPTNVLMQEVTEDGAAPRPG